MPRLRVTLREVEVDFRPGPVRGEGAVLRKPDVPPAELRSPHPEGDRSVVLLRRAARERGNRNECLVSSSRRSSNAARIPSPAQEAFLSTGNDGSGSTGPERRRYETSS
jgi:hypothetical protein